MSSREIGINMDKFNMLKPGDILMIHEPRYDRTILGISYWTHCLIFVNNDEFIDATGRYGVRISTLEKVKNRDNFDNYAILRVKGNYDVTKVIDFVEDKIGYPYDFRGWYFPDKQINPQKGEKGYGYTCTELIWAAYKATVDINIDSNGRGWITPWEMYTNKNIDVLYVQNPAAVVLKGVKLLFVLLTS
jgi:uncharacterized protein YycO